MRRKQQEEEEQREKDEVEAQKRREARARRPVAFIRLVSIREGDSDRVTPHAGRGRETGGLRPREDGLGRS